MTSCPETLRRPGAPLLFPLPLQDPAAAGPQGAGLAVSSDTLELLDPLFRSEGPEGLYDGASSDSPQLLRSLPLQEAGPCLPPQQRSSSHLSSGARFLQNQKVLYTVSS